MRSRSPGGSARAPSPRRSSRRHYAAAASGHGAAAPRGHESLSPSMEPDMRERTYRVTEIVGTSPEVEEPAIRGALRRARQPLRPLVWLEVTQIRGQIVDG